MKRNFRNLFLVCLIIVLAFTVAACGEKSTPAEQGSKDLEKKVDYPTKAVTLIVPFGAGGTMDVAVRALCKGFEEATGQPLVIENQPGGAGVPATNKFIKTKPDGYTITVLGSGILSLQPLLREVEYVFPKDFTPIIGIGDFQPVVAVKGDAPYNNMIEMLKYYKDKNEAIKVGGSGVNTPNHFTIGKISKLTGLEFRQLPYDDTNQAMMALLGGHVDMAMLNLANVATQMESGDIKLLSVTSTERYENLKEVPTLLEQGINATSGATFDIYGPANLPPEIAEILKEAFTKSMKSDQFKNFVTNANVYVTKFSAEEITNNILTDYKNFEKEINK